MPLRWTRPRAGSSYIRQAGTAIEWKHLVEESAMKRDPTRPSTPPDKRRPEAQPEEEPGTNAVEHEPDPDAKPIPDGEHKYIRRSPYTAGND
jgi:hypothetical protein